MDEAKSPQPEQVKAEPKVTEYYINTVGFSVSVYEFMLRFGLRGASPQEGPEPVVNIRMSPQHAKVMARMFARQVKAYEEEIGPIYLPQKLIQDLHLEDTEKL